MVDINKLKDVQTFLLDMDGTFYLGDKLLDGSLDFLSALKKAGKKALFVTNNSSKSGIVYEEKLARMGVCEEFRKVLTSGQAAGSYCMREFANKKAYVLGTPMFIDELKSMGLNIDHDCPDYVLMGYDTTLDYAKLTIVCDLVRQGVPYIATHPDFNCPTETGYAPDIGAMIAFIEASTKRLPDLVIGKPNQGIVSEALRLTGLEKHQLAMVGDRLYTDIATGKNFGMLSILVLTVEATMQDVASSSVVPDLIFDRLSDMNEYL